eukprot:10484291-Heterocapsa_arctica.AAC.1
MLLPPETRLESLLFPASLKRSVKTQDQQEEQVGGQVQAPLHRQVCEQVAQASGRERWPEGARREEPGHGQGLSEGEHGQAWSPRPAARQDPGLEPQRREQEQGQEGPRRGGREPLSWQASPSGSRGP